MLRSALTLIPSSVASSRALAVAVVSGTTRRITTSTMSQSTRRNSMTTTCLRPIMTHSSVFESVRFYSKVPAKFIPFPFAYHEELTLRVESMGIMGMGVCKTPVEAAAATTTAEAESDDETTKTTTPTTTTTTTRDWVVFVPGTIPGELVKVRVYRNTKRYSDADLLEVIEPSPHRVTPVCELSNKCGGCQFQHIAIEKQRDWKTEQVQDVLQRIGGFDNPEIVMPTVGTIEVFKYRSKLTPHYDTPRKIPTTQHYDIGPIGFRERNARRLVDVPYCAIATKTINQKLAAVREDLQTQAAKGHLKNTKNGATLLLRDSNDGVVTDNNQMITTTVSGLNFSFKAGNFFQNNSFILPIMVKHVRQAAKKPHPQTGRRMEYLVDCYCGSGLFCLSLASSFDVCVGIEMMEKAVKEANKNAIQNDIHNCEFMAASAEAIFETHKFVQAFDRNSTVVVVDPPRKGCSEEFLEQLYRYAPQRIVYMSCDVTTQARDAHGIAAAGYDIVSVQPFDLFPQTRHIECLIVFEKKPQQENKVEVKQ